MLNQTRDPEYEWKVGGIQTVKAPIVTIPKESSFTAVRYVLRAINIPDYIKFDYLSEYVEAFRVDMPSTSVVVARHCTSNFSPQPSYIQFFILDDKDKVSDNSQDIMSIVANAHGNVGFSFDRCFRAVYVGNRNSVSNCSTGINLWDTFSSIAFSVLNQINRVCWTWKTYFPKEKDFTHYNELVTALFNVWQMQRETSCSDTSRQAEIDRLNVKMKETRREVKRLEQELNRIFEDAADGLNFLEEHGIDGNGLPLEELFEERKFGY